MISELTLDTPGAEPSCQHVQEKPPTDKDKNANETLQEDVSSGVHKAFDLIRSAISPQSASNEPDEVGPKEDGKPSGKENHVPPEPPEILAVLTISEPQIPKGKKSKEEKEKAKKEKGEAKKAEKERKAKEKEEKKRLRKEKEIERKEKRRADKGKKEVKVEEVEHHPHHHPHPPLGSEPPADVESFTVTETLHHPGCHICEHPQEQGTINFLKESLDSWQGWPSFYDLTVAAKKLLGTGSPDEPHNTHQSDKTPTLGEQDLIEHIAAHIDRHIHEHFDIQPHEGGTHVASKALHPAHQHNGEQEGREDGNPANHGLDGNKDAPMTIIPGHILRSLEPASAPKIGTCQSPSRDCSPYRGPTSRCVSPWCEQLGFKMADSPKRNPAWMRRG